MRTEFIRTGVVVRVVHHLDVSNLCGEGRRNTADWSEFFASRRAENSECLRELSFFCCSSRLYCRQKAMMNEIFSPQKMGEVETLALLITVLLTGKCRQEIERWWWWQQQKLWSNLSFKSCSGFVGPNCMRKLGPKQGKTKLKVKALLRVRYDSFFFCQSRQIVEILGAQWVDFTYLGSSFWALPLLAASSINPWASISFWLP